MEAPACTNVTQPVRASRSPMGTVESIDPGTPRAAQARVANGTTTPRPSTIQVGACATHDRTRTERGFTR
ncbi:MAG: hypothetical protein R2704_17820 [Microthrixaceae bacterium]